MPQKLKKILTLFLTFLKIGAFTFGGGYAMIPLIEREVVDKRNWILKKDILDIVAIAESTPGPIAVNAATFIGFRIAGFWGAFFATLGVVLPSFLIIFAVSFIVKIFKNNEIVKFAFNGIRAGVLALIIKALISMYKQCPKGLFYYVLMGAVFLSAAFFNVNIILIIVVCAIFGIIYSYIAEKKVKA